ncbi:hypothetical protein PoB_005049100, partial [Plakobranchus ocellatus]
FEQSKQKNVTEAIKEVKNLLENVTSTTTKDVSIIADILQQIDVSEQTLPPSSVQDVLDVVSEISDLPEDDDLVSSETRANSSNSLSLARLISSMYAHTPIITISPSSGSTLSSALADTPNPPTHPASNPAQPLARAASTTVAKTPSVTSSLNPSLSLILDSSLHTQHQIQPSP